MGASGKDFVFLIKGNRYRGTALSSSSCLFGALMSQPSCDHEVTIMKVKANVLRMVKQKRKLRSLMAFLSYRTDACNYRLGGLCYIFFKSLFV